MQRLLPVTAFDQELNPESQAICKADMLIKGQDATNITICNSLREDSDTHKKLDSTLFNPLIRTTLKPVDPRFPPRSSSRVSLARCDFPLTSYRQ